MTEAASQPIPAKPALSLITRSGLLLAATPSILWLLLYFALAAHLRLGLGRWPDSIGDNPDTPLFQMHTELVWIYFTALLFSLFAVPLIIAVLVFLPRCRRFVVHLVAYSISIGLAWALMHLAPGSFVYWFFD